ncbi:MAG TPA: hypothetical protein VFT74_13285 [Isosphaeraceae bacterium]|nr:hypothetical protein [Isosphaeraceae bacterium]
MGDFEKRERRLLKKEIKRAGNKHRRHQLKRSLIENPDEAAHAEPSVGRHRSAEFNGLDRDLRRVRNRSKGEPANPDTGSPEEGD